MNETKTKSLHLLNQFIEIAPHTLPQVVGYEERRELTAIIEEVKSLKARLAAL